jgi:hypothetical protein
MAARGARAVHALYLNVVWITSASRNRCALRMNLLASGRSFF